MAISRMQQPRQMYNQGGLGALDAPRQNYGFGSFVKKAVRGVKKIVKSPLGKAALGAAIGFGIPGTSFGGLIGRAGMFGGEGAKGIFGNSGGIGGLFGKTGKFPGVGNLFRKSLKNDDGEYSTKNNPFSLGKIALGGLAAGAVALPFMGGKGDDEDEGPVDQMDPRYQVQRARNFYSGQGQKGVGLDFMPQKKYVNQNFYAADGGRAGYAGGGYLDDDEEEFMRSNAGKSMRQTQTFLNMGGGAGEAQAEQMLMAEFVKYKNKGGDLSFQQFVQAVMQQEQQSQGMQQPTMAADGGRMGYVDGESVQPFVVDETTDGMVIDMNSKGMDMDTMIQISGQPAEVVTKILSSLTQKANGGLTSVPGYGTPAGTNQFGYPSGGVRVGKAEGGIMETEEASEMIDMGGNEKDFRETGGFVEMGGEERADDVPARLSKNEFVFTADAVRAAGGGDIDQGSEVMQNMMDNLEQGGQVSEDSQGLGGGEEMMSEEIIEEPNGAQAMYDQQAMLQSRMA